MTSSFFSLTETKQSLQYMIKTHLSRPPMPKFEANMNYIHPCPSSSMKQCNKSATVKFHMKLLLIRPQSNFAVVWHHKCISAMFVLTPDSKLAVQENIIGAHTHQFTAFSDIYPRVSSWTGHISGSKEFQKRHSSCRTSAFQKVLVLLWFSLVHFPISSNWGPKTEFSSLQF